MLVYLIKISEDIIKVGMSSKSDLKRCLSYGANAKFLLISEIGDQYLLAEKAIIAKFKKKYELSHGREYFLCSDDLSAKRLFLDSINPFLEEKTTNPFARFAFRPSF